MDYVSNQSSCRVILRMTQEMRMEATKFDPPIFFTGPGWYSAKSSNSAKKYTTCRRHSQTIFQEKKKKKKHLYRLCRAKLVAGRIHHQSFAYAMLESFSWEPQPHFVYPRAQKQTAPPSTTTSAPVIYRPLRFPHSITTVPVSSSTSPMRPIGQRLAHTSRTVLKLSPAFSTVSM
jgi:hypothetical protein